MDSRVGNVLPLAGHELPPQLARLIPSRFVTIELASALTGLTEGAIRMKIARGVWLEDRQFVRRDGRVMIDMKGYEQWAESGRA
jgi:hypothetical protein